MDTTTQTNEPGVASLLKGIVDDAQELFKQQMSLFKHEVRSDTRKTIQASLFLALGGVVTLVGGVLLCLMLAYLLHERAQLPLWGSYAIVGGVVTVIGLALVYFGREKFLSFNPLPDESLAALEENLEWTTKPR